MSAECAIQLYRTERIKAIARGWRPSLAEHNWNPDRRTRLVNFDTPHTPRSDAFIVNRSINS